MLNSEILPYDGDVYYIRDFIFKNDSKFFFEKLKKTIQWQRKKIKIFGREIFQPRLISWYGDDEVSYTYSGLTLKALPWTKELTQLKSECEKHIGTNFNSVLLNFYRDGRDYMGPHSDKEKELGDRPLIASLSLGEERVFRFRHKKKKTKVDLHLEEGSLLVMKGDTQNFWNHELPKRSQRGERINLTFRNIN